MQVNSDKRLIVLTACYLIVTIVLGYLYIQALNDKNKYIELYNKKEAKKEQIVVKEADISKLTSVIDSLLVKYKSNDKHITNITNIHETEKANIKHLPVDSVVRNLSKWVSEGNTNR